VEREIESEKGQKQPSGKAKKSTGLFSIQMSEGFAVHEIILDANGKPCDYRFLELNDAFEKLTTVFHVKKWQGKISRSNARCRISLDRELR